MLNGKVIITTGGAGGIGSAAARIFAGYGATVYITDTDDAKAQSLADELIREGHGAAADHLDITDEENCKQVVARCLEKFGKIDGLVNFAAYQNPSRAPLSEVPTVIMEKTLRVNVTGTFNIGREVSKAMIAQKSGVIINISSQLSKLALPGFGPYPISKAAVNMLTEMQAVEMAPYNVRAIAVCPGTTNTEEFGGLVRAIAKNNAISVEDAYKRFTDSVPMKRLAEPVEIAETCAFLLSDKVPYLTGITVPVSGGKLLG